jgi:Type I restriction enzyme R protein N terminus (HSDR_N)
MPSRVDAAIEVRATLGLVKEQLASGTKLSEADTRANFIDPLLGALGYKGIATIEREVYAKDTKEFLDYVLKIGGQPRIAVEAKAIGKALTDADAAQVIQYCSILGIEWAVVTNAREWRLYHQFAQSDLAGKLLFDLDLVGWTSTQEFESLFDQLWLVSREAFEGSDGPKGWLRAQRLDASLRDALTNPASVEVKYLRKRLADQDIEATQEDVATWFKGKLLEAVPIPSPKPPPPAASTGGALASSSRPNYWMAPASSRPGMSAEQALKAWLGKGMWGFGESTPGRKSIRAADWIAFYATGTGVVAYAQVTGEANLLVQPSEWPESIPQSGPTYKIPLRDVTWLPNRNRIDAQARSQLDAFQGRDPNGNWSWLVQTTRRLSQADFNRLTLR